MFLSNYQTITKNVDLSVFRGLSKVFRKIFEILHIHKLYLESCESPRPPQQIGFGVFTFIWRKQTIKQTSKVYITRITERFAPIYHFNCKHFLCVYIGNQKQKSSRIYKKKFVDFFYIKKIVFRRRLICEILIIYKPSLGSCRVPQKNLARYIDSAIFTFNGHKQTNKQTSMKYIYFVLD